MTTPLRDDEHGSVEVKITTALENFVSPRKLGKVKGGEVGIVTRRNPDRVRGADALYISNEQYVKRTEGLAYLDVAPEIVVEVLSPEDRALDVNEKVREFLAMGAKQVWLADPRARAVLVCTITSIRQRREGEMLTAPDILPGFEVPVARLFET